MLTVTASNDVYIPRAQIFGRMIMVAAMGVAGGGDEFAKVAMMVRTRVGLWRATMQTSDSQ